MPLLLTKKLTNKFHELTVINKISFRKNDFLFKL